MTATAARIEVNAPEPRIRIEVKLKPPVEPVQHVADKLKCRACYVGVSHGRYVDKAGLLRHLRLMKTKTEDEAWLKRLNDEYDRVYHNRPEPPPQAAPIEYGQHPVYGQYVKGFKPIEGFPDYYIDEHCTVIGPRVALKTDQDRVLLHLVDGTKRKGRTYRMVLRAFFPLIEADETVDHTDEVYTNNHLDNLQWMSNEDNARKSNALRPRTHRPQAWKAVQELESREGDPKVDGYYESITGAAKALGIKHAAHISRSADSNGEMAVCGRFFIWADDGDLEGEVWKTSAALDKMLKQVDTPDDKKVKVSSKGRVRSLHGVKTIGSRARKCKYRKVAVNGRKYNVHTLVYVGFNNKPAPNPRVKVDGEHWNVCHDDAIPLVDGCHRNWAQDLRLGTAKDNSQQSADHRKKLREQAAAAAAPPVKREPIHV